MACPKGQPYVDNTYCWPKEPAIIPRDSYLGRRPSVYLYSDQILLILDDLPAGIFDHHLIVATYVSKYLGNLLMYMVFGHN